MLFDWLFKKYSYENTRQYKRLPVSWPVKYDPSAPKTSVLLLLTKNISAGGLALFSKEMFPVGSLLQLEILVPPLQKTIRATGRVLRCVRVKGGEFELGVQFEEIDPNEQVLLNQEIETFYSDKTTALHSKWWRKLP